jgi:hypothetical protein
VCDPLQKYEALYASQKRFHGASEIAKERGFSSASSFMRAFADFLFIGVGLIIVVLIVI